MSSTHLITRVAFELELRNRQRAPLLQNRVSSFASARMNSILIDSLSFAPSVAQPLVAGNVELDLGEISFARLEDDLAAGIARRLREWALHIKLHEHAALHELSSGSQPQDRVHPFPDEICKPSSAGRLSATTGDLGKAVAGALHNPEEWPQLAQSVRDNHSFRRRLAAEASPQLLDRLVKALFPECTAWTAELSSALISLHGITPLVPADRATFRRTLWECLLTVLARESKTVAKQAFAAKLVQLLAARHSLQPGVLASRITENFNHLSRGSLNSGTHPASLKELNAALVKLNGASLPNVVERSPLASATLPGLEPVSVGASESVIEKLAGFLQWGVWPELDVHGAGHGPQAEMLRLLASSPDEICALLRRMGEMQVVRKRIARQFSEKVLRRVMFGFDPVNTSWMVEFMTELRRLHAQQPLVARENRQFGELLWELALEYLSEHGWSAKNGASFLRFLLQRLALGHQGMYQLLL
ncbi:MAG TPA: contractile injection system tape measure protein, partial [Candidatus Angelobacter sp.]|nr:contractile injection system tape measure protein [Candidatus Angelobacter sp.]